MNDIINLLDFEDTNVAITNTAISNDTKTITVERKAEPHFCPVCGYLMHSKGIRTRYVNHPILQDGFHLVIELKQRRWKCTNPNCNYENSEQFSFVDPKKRSTKVTDFLILEDLKDISLTSAAIAEKFNVSDTYVFNVLNRYVKMDRLPLGEAVSIDEVYLDLDDYCKYVLIIMDFISGEPIDMVRSRRNDVTQKYFQSIPRVERDRVKYLISDMYAPYLNYVDNYFHNAMPIVDSFHVVQWIINELNKFLRELLRYYKNRDKRIAEEKSLQTGKPISITVSNEVYLLERFKWILLRNQENIDYQADYHIDHHYHCMMNTYAYEEAFMKLHPDMHTLRWLKEKYIDFNNRNAGNPLTAQKELDELIEFYSASGYAIFEEFAKRLIKYRTPILNSFIMVERYTNEGKIKSRLSNGPIESINRKIKDLKRNCRGFRNFDHARNRFLYGTRKNPPINGR